MQEFVTWNDCVEFKRFYNKYFYLIIQGENKKVAEVVVELLQCHCCYDIKFLHFWVVESIQFELMGQLGQVSLWILKWNDKGSCRLCGGPGGGGGGVGGGFSVRFPPESIMCVCVMLRT